MNPDITSKIDISKIDIAEVAKIAAAIQTPGLCSRKKIQAAFYLLEWAHHYKERSIASGYPPSRIFYCDEQGLEPGDDEEHPWALEAQAIIRTGKAGEPLPVPFEEGLAHMMPRVKSISRHPRFASYMESKGKGASLAEFKKTGFPGGVYESLFVGFRIWWDREKRSIKGRAGKAKKGRQGRVVKKNDKRKGGRLAGKLFQALKKTA